MSDSAKTVPLDAIVEAVFEIRFTSSLLSDLVLGRLSSLWPKATAVRLPTADIPMPVRRQDPQLAVAPILELHNVRPQRVVKLAEQGISYHCVGTYPRWVAFHKELSVGFADLVVDTLPGFRATRLGLRYVNVFTQAAQGVKEIADLQVQVSVGGKAVEPPILLNYQDRHANDLELTVRAASRTFVTTDVAGATAIVDLDVYTPGNNKHSTPASMAKWLDRAHTAMKAEFSKFAPAGTHVL